ncbi:ABC transporter substrate-binding protein [Arenibacter sp. GZD96]|uniref:ABC transporter substrate-binding protein n=1 Tax=Aurantibrevibacter litoralis TaxID=3106030 RepID=UPI002AFE4EA3|nr:ABC transporter substrate-binding protein [Arenibacter sp. GZD-96]MEA1786908.1 ABC transporter substrate-binding protein [Arenibacter sp. GZD-96]
MKKLIFVLVIGLWIACKETQQERTFQSVLRDTTTIAYAKGFRMVTLASGVKEIEVVSPWPNAQRSFTYALVPKEMYQPSLANDLTYDAVVPIPVQRLIVTSTTHIPALEALGVGDRLIGFPGTTYISSMATRLRIDSGLVQELGQNETLNTELAVALEPDLLIGFGVENQNRVYETLKNAGIPVVYNGDWTEETPLGKSEWIKFFAPFFGLEKKADSIFKTIETAYKTSKNLAQRADTYPTVLSGALYKDVWYMPGGSSWAAQFIKDAHANYLWKDNSETGSLSLSMESVWIKGKDADFWIGPAQFTSYSELAGNSTHYTELAAYKNKKTYTFAATTGATGGLLYYELAPSRPDLVLKDLIHILHPELLPNHELIFYKPLLP